MVESKEIKEMAEKASELAKNIWLAGLGAYGKALDEAQDQYGKVSVKVNEQVDKVKEQVIGSDSTRLFEELVAKGKKLESQTSEKFTEVKDKAAATLEERLAQVKESLNFANKGDDVSAQLADLSSKLDLVMAAVGTQTEVKKVVAKKAAATSKAAE